MERTRGADLNGAAETHIMAGDEIDWSAHPSGATGSVLVRLKFNGFLGIVEQYDDSRCEATTNLMVVYEWEDPRLIDFPEGQQLPDNIWQPEFHVYGQVNNAEHGYGGAAGSLSLKDRAKGTLLWMVQNKGVVFNCKKTHDITEFPFDSQIVLIFFSCGKTVAGATDCVRFSADSDMATFGAPGRGERIERQAEWETTAVAYGTCQHSSSIKSYHNAYVAVKRRRVPDWYLHKGLGPTVMCAVLSLTALVVPSETNIGDRLATLLTLLLTVFAVQWVTQDRLPRTPDLTYMDRVVNLVVCLIVLSSVFSALFMLAVRLGYSPETIDLAELVSATDPAAQVDRPWGSRCDSDLTARARSDRSTAVSARFSSCPVCSKSGSTSAALRTAESNAATRGLRNQRHCFPFSRRSTVAFAAQCWTAMCCGMI